MNALSLASAVTALVRTVYVAAQHRGADAILRFLLDCGLNTQAEVRSDKKQSAARAGPINMIGSRRASMQMPSAPRSAHISIKIFLARVRVVSKLM